MLDGGVGAGILLHPGASLFLMPSGTTRHSRSHMRHEPGSTVSFSTSTSPFFLRTSHAMATSVMAPPKTKMVNDAMISVVCRMASESDICGSSHSSRPSLASSVRPPHVCGKSMCERDGGDGEGDAAAQAGEPHDEHVEGRDGGGSDFGSHRKQL